MTEDEHRHPTTDQPLNAEKRPRVTPVLAVAIMVAVVAIVFLLITWVQQNS